MYRTAADKVDAMDLIKVAKVDDLYSLIPRQRLGELESCRPVSKALADPHFSSLN